MPKIRDDIVKSVIDSADIIDVVSDHIGWRTTTKVGLRKIGVRYTAICPFHDDRHDGNFIVYPKGNCFKCFACEASGGPLQFVMMYSGLSFPDAVRWIGHRYGIDVDDAHVVYTPPPPPQQPPQLPTLVLPGWIVKNRMVTDNDNLCNWIRRGAAKWDYCQMMRVEDVLKSYMVGHSTIKQNRIDGSEVRHEFTVFWQIDESGNVRTGHMMKYDENGKRVKKEHDRYCQDWVHSLLRGHREDPPWPHKDLYDPDTHDVRYTLFGMHLLANATKNTTVNIVESEKTALVMAVAYGNNACQLWMACGGLSNINRERLKPIIERRLKIMLYPDRDGVDQWTRRAELLHYDLVNIETDPVLKWWNEDDGEKADVADVVLRIIRENN